MDGKAPFSPINHLSTAEQVVAQIEHLLLEGVLSAGEKLPSERDLAERLGVSRPILREALAILEVRGLIIARHGGGTFVADLVGEVFSRPLAELIARNAGGSADYLAFRRLIEGEAAELAAQRATPADLDRLSAILSEMEEAERTGDDRRALDADIALHQAIGEAAHNVILMHTLNACYRLIAEGIMQSRDRILDRPGVRAALLGQHRAIIAAIAAGDAETAGRAARAHIDFVAAASEEARAFKARADISEQRQAARSAPRQRLKERTP